MTPIPELSDPDRSAIQEASEATDVYMEAATEFVTALSEAFRALVDVIVEFYNPTKGHTA